MTILTIRTDKPEAEIGLYQDMRQLGSDSWQAHRILAETLHDRLRQALEAQGLQWKDVEGIIVYQGPGSFTGLRIGITVANSLAYGLKAAVVGTQGENWLAEGLQRLMAGQNDTMVLPEYGAEAHITQQKK